MFCPGGKIVQLELSAQFRSVSFLLPECHALPALRRRMLPVAEDERLFRLDEMSLVRRRGRGLFEVERHLLVAVENTHQQLQFKAAQRIGPALLHLPVGFLEEEMQSRHRLDRPPGRIGHGARPQPAEMLRTADGCGDDLCPQQDLLLRQRPFDGIDRSAHAAVDNPGTGTDLPQIAVRETLECSRFRGLP